MSRRIETSKDQPECRKDQVLALTRRVGVLRPRDLDAEGIPREYLRRLPSGRIAGRHFGAVQLWCDLACFGAALATVGVWTVLQMVVR
jgi:hypothetical protein